MAYVVPVAPAVTFGRGSPIYGTAVHPSGLIGIAPIRVLVSPFEKRVKAADSDTGERSRRPPSMRPTWLSWRR